MERHDFEEKGENLKMKSLDVTCLDFVVGLFGQDGMRQLGYFEDVIFAGQVANLEFDRGRRQVLNEAAVVVH